MCNLTNFKNVNFPSLSLIENKKSHLININYTSIEYLYS